MQTLKDNKHPSLSSDLVNLFRCLSPRRKWQLGALFILQSASAVSEVVSLGAVIPFLGALTNADTLIKDPRFVWLVKIADITTTNQLIILVSGLFATAIVFANILRFLTLWAQSYLSAAIGADFGRLLFRNTLYQPYSFFVRNNSSHLISNMTNDLSGTLGVIQNIFTIVTQALIGIAIAVGLVAYNPKVAIALSTITIISFTALTFFMRKMLYRNSVLTSDSYRSFMKALQEGFGGIRYLALNKAHSTFIDYYGNADRLYRHKTAESSVVRQAPRFFIEAIGVVAISALAMAFALKNANISKVIPLLGFLALGCYRLLPAVQQVYASIGTLLGLEISLHRTIEMLAAPISTDLLTKPKSTLFLNNALHFETVGFDYAGRENAQGQWTLKDISFSIKAKTTVAFVGPTGSGKSTISDLILGLIQPQKGRITIDGIPLTPHNMAEWQNGISHVAQNIFLTDSSISENIAFGIKKPDIDMVRVRECAKLARIDQFIETLAEGYNTSVGERGVRLSGGQLQRIGIARALYNKPALIVFDEATSALDNRTEQEVMGSIESLGHDQTIILIAHRLSTVRKADMIFVLDHGSLVASGTYDDLMSTSTYFQKFVQEIELNEAA